MGKFFGKMMLPMLLVLCLVFVSSALAADVPSTQWADYAADAFAGGTGTQADPYRIETAEQLAKLAVDVKNRQDYNGAYFRLENDLDLSAHRWNPIGAFTPSNSRAFRGFLDGNYKTITGMNISEMTGDNSVGLFGYIGKSSGTEQTGVKDLTIANAYIEASDDPSSYFGSRIGILSGFLMANEGYTVDITNVTVSGKIRVDSNCTMSVCGGLLGDANRATVQNCQALDMDIRVTNCGNAGGIVGMDGGSQYNQCRATGKLKGHWALGGFVGYATTSTYDDPNTGSTFSRCYADVDVNGCDWRLGGFVGLAEYATIQNSAAVGDVESSVTQWQPNLGGIVGESKGATIDRTHYAGKITVANYNDSTVGGAIGTGDSANLNEVSFDAEKNPNLNGIGSMVVPVTGEAASETSQKTLSNICRDYYVDGHAWGNETIVDREPTCAEDGLQSKHCTRCGEHGSQELIPKTDNHQFEWVIDRPAAIGVPGSKHQECTVCGLQKDPVEIPALANPPKTGDSRLVALWFVLLVISGGMMAAALFAERKRTINH